MHIGTDQKSHHQFVSNVAGLTVFNLLPFNRTQILTNRGHFRLLFNYFN